MKRTILHWWRKACIRHNPNTRLRLEALEDRLAPAAVSAFPAGVVAPIAIPAPASVVTVPNTAALPHGDVVFLNPLLILPGGPHETPIAFSPSGGGAQPRDERTVALAGSDAPAAEESEGGLLDDQVWSAADPTVQSPATDAVLTQVAEAVVATD